MEKKIAPSLMCCDFMRLGEQIRTFEENGIELLHIDVMDGHFVPNVQFGTDLCRKIKAFTNIPLDYHFMVEKPETFLDYFRSIGEGDYVSVHVESTCHMQRVLQAIRDRGARAMAAINPATPIGMLEEILYDIDGVLVMSVNPGYAGQKLIPGAIGKIAKLRKYLDDHGKADVEVEVDGNVSFENGRRMSEAGANIFVAGSSSVFRRGLSLEEGIAELRNSIHSHP